MCAKLISNRPRAANLNGAFCSNEEKELTYSDFTFYTCFEGDVTSVPAKSNGSGSDKVPCLELSDKLSDLLIRDVDVMFMSVPGDAYAVFKSFDFSEISVHLAARLDPDNAYYDIIETKLKEMAVSRLSGTSKVVPAGVWYVHE